LGFRKGSNDLVESRGCNQENVNIAAGAFVASGD
jgi:hypothetical protein